VSSDNDVRMAKIETSFESVKEKLDTHGVEIKSLRDSRHKHSGILQNHTGILTGLQESVDRLIVNLSENTGAIRDFKTIVITAMFMGAGFISFVVFVGGKIIKWW